jgi:hypothetical protein
LNLYPSDNFQPLLHSHIKRNRCWFLRSNKVTDFSLISNEYAANFFYHLEEDLDTKELVINGYIETVHPKQQEALAKRLNCSVAPLTVSRKIALALIGRSDFRKSGPFGFLNGDFAEGEKKACGGLKRRQEKIKNFSAILEKAFEQTLLVLDTLKEKKMIVMKW